MLVINVILRCFHSLGLAVLPILGVWAENVDKFVASELFVPAAASLLSVIVGLFIFYRLTGNLERASLAVSTIFFATVYYGPLASVFVGDAGFGWPLSNCWFAVLWLVFWAVETYIFARKVRSLKALTTFANVFVAVLVFFNAWNILSYHALMKPRADLVVLNDDLNHASRQTASLPDIYYIVLDSYAGNDTLKSLYDFDNSDFTDFLEEQGFFVASASRSNYPLTYFSLASSLNMGYLATGKNHSPDFHGFSPLVDLIADSLVVREFKQLGYQTIAFSSGYMATEMRQFDRFIADSPICRELLCVLSRKTILASCNFGSWNLVRFHADAHRNAIRKVFSELPSVAGKGQPAFVFAHLLTPHAPFVFARDGSPLDLPYFDYSDGMYLRRYMDISTYRKNYVDQLIYVNSQLKDCISRLLADKSRKKVIIIQADHGPASDVDYSSLERTNILERMSILNAIYLPDSNHDGLKPSLSPVNNFRAVFKKALNNEISLLPDKSHYVTFKDLYKFVDITNKAQIIEKTSD
ncbi:MAG: hypothetical protein GQF41_3664 [Candidatus Rifleibacterium amylolyticum]|nr:MAG: hypothetical protein GQF41_3664 [Candidatus Rifleibacterium amylolyticum]